MPSGKGYDKCRSVHSEQNAMLSAARKDMIGATLYMVGINQRNGEYVKDNWPCTFCKRMLINSRNERSCYEGYQNRLSNRTSTRLD